MADANFHVHLISNVAPEIFPENNPSEFSTPLANEINLSNGEWEVAVRQIMYPTRISTTSPSDKIIIQKYAERHRDLLPFPPEYLNSVADSNASISFKPGSIAKEKLVDYVTRTINTSPWSSMLSIEFKGNSKKFALHVSEDDIVVVLSKELQHILGFKESHFARGSYWAWSTFKENMIVPEDIDTKLFLIDLQALHKETHNLPMSMDANRNHRMYEKTVPHLFKDTVPDEFISEPKFSFGVNPNEGCIKIKPLQPDMLRNFELHENKLVFFRFDSNATKHLKLQKRYYYHGEEVIRIPLVPALVKKEERKDEKKKQKPKKREADENSTQLGKRRKVDTTGIAVAEPEETYILDNVRAVTVEFFYLSRHADVYSRLMENPVETITLDSDIETKEPQALLSKFNQNIQVYKYKFDWLAELKRFQLTVDSPNYVVHMTKSLASVLGFDPFKTLYTKGTYVARDSPILNREITALYVYTNIVSPVYIGDVKAPLLLTCPFKRKGSHDNVHQIEFLNPTYTPLNRNVINQIDIGIYDDAGALVPFIHGKTKVSLHFRKHR